jgi:phosphatidylserine/phosphatidylglycerophosphate/cardiolipin synthase-like enzyme
LTLRSIASRLGVAALGALLVGCASLPPVPADRVASTAIADGRDTQLGRLVAPLLAAAPEGTSGFHALADPRDAFAARMALAAAAERSIDAQYYIWHGDRAGTLLFEALWRAAERGVRVRLLLDDANTRGLDRVLAALEAHPNVEVRLYNPFVQRSARVLGFATDFGRLNRRMHNKSFTADNVATIVGGRNIGDEYFAAGDGADFADLDVIGIGPAVAETSTQFDRYWNSASAYPAAAFVGPPGADGARELEARFAATRSDPASIDYVDAVRRSALVEELQARRLAIDWAVAHVVQDDPAKTLDASDRSDVLLFPELIRTIGRPERSLDIVSPYFVPGDEGTAALAELARRGVRVRILTNSLAASDVSAVHAGYMKRRRDLLLAGIQLYELTPLAAAPHAGESRTGSGGASGLHAKTYAVDGARIFVGSFNFDPRSARLNTELGVVIESAALAGRLASAFDSVVPLRAYEVRLAGEGDGLQWIERSASGGEKRHDHEPETSALKRFGVQILSILPIEWLL